MNLLNDAFSYLHQNGHNPQRLGESIIRFTSSGINCLLFWNEQDRTFLKIDARYDMDQFNSSADSMLKKCNKINKEVKIIKAHIDYDENILVLSTEILLDSTPDIKSLLGRLIIIINQTTLMLL